MIETKRYVEAKPADAKCLSCEKPPKSKRSVLVLKDAKRRSLDDVVRRCLVGERMYLRTMIQYVYGEVAVTTLCGCLEVCREVGEQFADVMWGQFVEFYVDYRC